MSETNRNTTGPGGAQPGGRMPAEWAPHAATWFSWPHNPDTWPGVDIARVEAVLAEAVAHLITGEHVRINVLDAAHETHVRGVLREAGVTDRVHFHHFPTNDAWCRDHGAIFVASAVDGQPLALNFRYNAWGGKYPPYDLDDRIPGQMAHVLGVRRSDIDMVLEGGSIEVNGAGCLLTTEQCLLNPNRNPDMDRSQIEAELSHYLGVQQIIWLGEGIVGDDTDGHVDDLTRFVAEDAVVTMVESDPDDANYLPLKENRERLTAVELRDGRPLRVIELPTPAPLMRWGERLPASYANFYIANSVVLLPVFGCDADERATRVLQGCFPERRVVPLDCRDVVVGLGAFHCLTQQVPAAIAPGLAKT